MSGDGAPMLVLAAERSVPVAMALIQASADVNVIDPAGRSALEVAVAQGEAELAELLLLRGAKPTRNQVRGTRQGGEDVGDWERGGRGCRAGQVALAKGEAELAEMLLLRGARPTRNQVRRPGERGGVRWGAQRKASTACVYVKGSRGQELALWLCEH
jgi:ankyrin repeat protein